MSMSDKHECINVTLHTDKPAFFECRTCPFSGDLAAAIEHTVSNQFKVVSSKGT